MVIKPVRQCFQYWSLQDVILVLQTQAKYLSPPRVLVDEHSLIFPTPIFITPGRATAIPAFPDHHRTTHQQVGLASVPVKLLLLPCVLVHMKPCVRPPGSCYTCSFLLSSQSYCTFPSFFFLKFIYFQLSLIIQQKAYLITYIVLSTFYQTVLHLQVGFFFFFFF